MGETEAGTIQGLPLRSGRPAFRACDRGSAAVEFALVSLPFFMLLIGVLQFMALHFMQNTLSDALYVSASSPETELLSGSKTAYVTKLCNKTPFPVHCKDNIQVELQRLSDLPVGARTAIDGSKFQAGSANDVMSLRVSTSVINFATFMPTLTARAAVVFRR